MEDAVHPVRSQTIGCRRGRPGRAVVIRDAQAAGGRHEDLSIGHVHAVGGVGTETALHVEGGPTAATVVGDVQPSGPRGPPRGRGVDDPVADEYPGDRNPPARRRCGPGGTAVGRDLHAPLGCAGTDRLGVRVHAGQKQPVQGAAPGRTAVGRDPQAGFRGRVQHAAAAADAPSLVSRQSLIGPGARPQRAAIGRDAHACIRRGVDDPVAHKHSEDVAAGKP